MLRVASFDISEGDAINTLLDKYRLAASAHILVSEGKLCIPYEDGEPPTDVQRIVALKEDKHQHETNMDVIEHSQKVLAVLIDDATERASEATANVEEAKKRKAKQHEMQPLLKKEHEAKQAIEQLEAQVKQNQHEIMRLVINCRIFDEKIEELS